MQATRAWVAALLLIGCGGGKQSTEATVPTPVAEAAPAKPKPKGPAPGLPDGYVTMYALGMLRLDQSGGAVILSDEQRTVFVPIFIGGTEAISITFRLRGEPFKRPLTHDLIDSLLAELDAQLAQVQVDTLRDNTYVGSILVHAGDRVFRLDARPSDAIALATGNAIPIYVAQVVIDKAGVPADSPDAGPYKAAVFGRGMSSGDLVVAIEDLADRACACKDVACLQSVNVELMTLVENADETTPADQAEILKSVQRMNECVEKQTQSTP